MNLHGKWTRSVKHKKTQHIQVDIHDTKLEPRPLIGTTYPLQFETKIQ